MTGTGYINRRDIYNVLGGPILVVLYYINAISKAVIYRKSAKMTRTDSIYCMKTPISLVTTTIREIKS